VQSTTSTRITDYYTKGGDIGVYSTLLALIPDYDVGFTIFTADGSAANVAALLSNMVADTFGVALEKAAKMQAVGKFAGSYAAANGTNSSVVISASSDTFGLTVQRWTSEGSDMFANIALTQGISSTSSLQVEVRLVPTGLQEVDEATGMTSVAFRAVFGFQGTPSGNVFDLNCATWTTVDALAYAGLSIDQFIFQVDGDGKVMGLSLPALKAELLSSL